MHKAQVKKQITLKLQVEEDIVHMIKEAEEIQAKTDRVMRQAMPTFKDAIDGLMKITKKEINELKTIVHPLPIILKLMTAVCMLLDEPPTIVSTKATNFTAKECYWATSISCRVLGHRNIIQRLTQIDPTTISAHSMEKLENLIATGELTPETV